jgi:hypothetical protein
MNAEPSRPARRLFRLGATALVALLMVFFAASREAAAFGPGGIWLLELDDGIVAIELRPCGAAICGRIVGVDERIEHPALAQQAAATGISPRDHLCGLRVMEGFRRTAPNLWEEGSILNPLDGKVYNGRFSFDGADTLRVRAYLGTPFFGETHTLVRADQTPIIGRTQLCTRDQIARSQ